MRGIAPRSRFVRRMLCGFFLFEHDKYGDGSADEYGGTDDHEHERYVSSVIFGNGGSCILGTASGAQMILAEGVRGERTEFLAAEIGRASCRERV